MADIPITSESLPTRDLIQGSLVSGAATVSTTAVAVRVGASNLTGRKVLIVQPTNGTIYWGASASVTTATGMPVFAHQNVTLAVSDNVTVYAIAAGPVSVSIVEGA